MVASGLSTDDHQLSYYKDLAVNSMRPDNLQKAEASPIEEG